MDRYFLLSLSSYWDCILFAWRLPCKRVTPPSDSANWSKLLTNLWSYHTDDLNRSLTCIPLTLLSPCNMHTIWFIFYVYSISGFCFSFWSSHSLEWTGTWLTHVYKLPPVKSTHVHQHFGFGSLCILNRILDQFNAHQPQASERATEQTRHSFESFIRSSSSQYDMHSIREVSWNYSLNFRWGWNVNKFDRLHWFY